MQLDKVTTNATFFIKILLHVLKNGQILLVEFVQWLVFRIVVATTRVRFPDSTNLESNHPFAILFDAEGLGMMYFGLFDGR